MKVIVTGSSGYVGSHIIDILKKNYDLLCIDKEPSIYTDIVADIADHTLESSLDLNEEYILVNLAACRTDHDVTAKEYFESNVRKHEIFLEMLSRFKLLHFIHMSSVAAIDGASMEFDDGLNEDDAYRATKFLQSELIQRWCKKKKIPLTELLPSAIYHDAERRDTNIGKLQNIARYLPMIPKIENKKSLTYLPKLCEFTRFIISSRMEGRFITIEMPVQTVTEIIKRQIESNKPTIKFFGLQQILLVISYIAIFISKLINFEPRLTPNRVKKLFSDTSYLHSNLNKEIYAKFKIKEY